jgi:hypothetical protein
VLIVAISGIFAGGRRGRVETEDWGLEIGDWGLEIGDWRLEIGDWRLEICGISNLKSPVRLVLYDSGVISGGTLFVS